MTDAAQGFAEGAKRQREADAKILADVRYHGASTPFMAKVLRTTPCVQMLESIVRGGEVDHPQTPTRRRGR